MVETVGNGIRHDGHCTARRVARLSASRYLVPLASPLAGQSSLGVFKHPANSRVTPLKQGLSWPPFALSATNLRRLGRMLASRDTGSRYARASEPRDAASRRVRSRVPNRSCFPTLRCAGCDLRERDRDRRSWCPTLY